MGTEKEAGLYQSLDEAADSILRMISELIQVDTFFVASNDKLSNTIVKAFNRHEPLIEEGVSLPYEQTYCSLVIEAEARALVIEDTAAHPVTCGMGVTAALGGCSFIGVPISLRGGRIYGTICAMNREPYRYSERDIHLLSSMAAFLTYVIELENSVEALKRSKEETLQAKEAAERATKTKAEFLAMMSHEIRTPMNGIMGMTSLLQTTELTDEQQEYTEVIRSSNESLLSILNDILDFSKMESGKMMLDNQPFDLRSCVEDILDLFASRTLEKEIELVSYVDPEIPPFIVGDATRTRQVLANLVGNAVKFTSCGEIFVSVTKQSSEDPGMLKLYVTVQDTGIGIAPGNMGALFQSFSQAHTPETNRQYGGTGLGLAICKQLVELMGGEIWVDSTEGEGTTFHFTMVTGCSGLFFDNACHEQLLRHKRVLVVDDSSTNLRILKTTLEKKGMFVRATVSAYEALHWLRQGEIFDLAVIDMRMREMNGVQLGRQIRKHRTVESLPMIMLSSVGMDQRETVPHLLFHAVITKPVRENQLLEVVKACLLEVPPAPARAKLQPVLDDSMADRYPLRILVAEDNAINQKLFLRILEKMGYDADVVANGMEAVGALSRLHYDIVFMDVQMPVMDGLEAAKWIAGHVDAARKPVVIAVTANARQEDREQCLASGMDDYLSKPLRIDEVRRMLEFWAKGIRSGKHAAGPNRDGIIDRDMIEEVRGLGDGSPAFLDEVFEMFVSDADTYITEIRQLWERRELSQIASKLHMLKGICLNIGAARLAEVCVQLEGELKQLDALEARMEDLAHVFEETKHRLGELAGAEANPRPGR
ncbi:MULTISPECIES: response regulator [Paenibacillus]|uniref:response regulator n=1 Tax=Paenibacillus TaxID=44249 RepID=UPI0022B92F63|nr:response regulator [Paenibacillus caseinilyticus]MCZ8523292.1 response regulator [Paenibacillus caseinilyticus]